MRRTIAQMSTIQSFSRDLILLLMEYVNYQERIEFICCCQEWYHGLMKKFIRTLRIVQRNKIESLELLKLIDNPSRQLVLPPIIQISRTEIPIELFQAVNYSFQEIHCELYQFMEMMTCAEKLKAKKVGIRKIEYKPNSLQEIADCFARVTDCASLSLSFPYQTRNSTLTVSLQCFTSHLSALHTLILNSCPITDVSMLGSIPHLELKYCNHLVDISSLNNNETIVIEECINIRDYSHSFAHSRKIKIRLTEFTEKYFDLNRWKKVEDLCLTAFFCRGLHFHDDDSLPITVRQCALGGSFASAIDFTVTADHALTKLKLWNNNSITSLMDYGLERVVTIDCDGLNRLESLEGLGRGRNRKIIVHSCSNVTDFSPVNHIPIVEIKSCKGFNDPLQVKFVRDLHIIPITNISFKANLIPHNNPLLHVHYLGVFDTLANDYSMEFDGLEKIPHLKLEYHSCYHLLEFLETGKQIENQSITIAYYKYTTYAMLLDIHKRFLSQQYDYINTPFQKWIWIRKAER